MYNAKVKYYIKHRTGRTTFYKEIPLEGDTKEEINKIALSEKRKFQKNLGIDVIFNTRYTKKVLDDQNNKDSDNNIDTEIIYESETSELDKIRLGLIKSHELKAKDSIDLLDKYDIDIFNEGGFLENEERTTVLNKYEQKNKE